MGGYDTKANHQVDGKETEQFLTKILQPKEQNKKTNRISNITRELEGFEEGPEAEIYIDLVKTTLKNTRMENALPWWNTKILVQEIDLHSG